MLNPPKRKNGRFKKGFHYSISTEFKKGQHWRKPKTYWNKEWLYNEYIIKNKSSGEIAKSQSCGEGNILYWLKKHNIKIRSISETRKIKYWGLNGKDNPMWGKRKDLNHNWKGGISPERQEFYNTEEWKKACYYVWKRDKAVCQRCKILFSKLNKLHVHHIVSFENKELRSDTNNLVLLCKSCHNFIHSKKNVNNEFIDRGWCK